MATATLKINNDDFRSSLRIEEGRLVGVRHYEVDTQDELELYNAAGLPRVNQTAWSAAYPNVICRVVDPVERYGQGIYTRVACQFASPAPGGGGVVGGRGRDWSEMRSERGSVVQLWPLASGDSTPIADGDGAQREISSIVFRVHAFLTLAEFSQAYINRLVALRDGFVNSGAVTIPRIQGTSRNVTLAAGQARYAGFEFVGEFDAQTLEVVHTIAAAPDHRVYWRTRQAGGVYGPERSAAIYGSASFDGLWSLA